MKLDPRVRKVAVFGSLALTLLALRWVDGEPDLQKVNAASGRKAGPAEASASSARPADPPPPPTLALDLTRLKRGGSAPKSVDAFGVRDWNPPPRKLTPKEIAAQPAPPPPPPPQAPPLPFTYVGMLGDEDDTVVFLAQQDTNHAVKKGEVINGTYRVDEIDAGRVVLTYLPLDQRQTLTAKTE